MKVAAIASSLLIFATYAFACTTVQIPASPQNWVLKSYDWHLGHFTAFMNPSGLKKKAFHFKPVNLATWTSKYSSLTFNQHGRELPLGGVNEAGLVVEILWLNGTEYATPAKGQEVVNELQWIQYQLDRFSTVREVVDHLNKVAVVSIYAKVHYLVCDTTSECATIEFLEGAPVIHTGKDLVTRTLANHTYEDSLFNLGKYAEFGGKIAEAPKGTDSLDRFTRAAIAAKNYSPSVVDPVHTVFGILRGVAQGDYTKLNLAYDRKNSISYFRTHSRPSIKFVDLNRFYHSCANGRTAKVMNLNLPNDGEVTDEFQSYTLAANQKLVDEGLADLASVLPDGALKKVAKYPDSFVCEF